MKKQSASLSSDLLSRKGQAVPPTDMPARSASSEDTPKASSDTTDELQPLNFRVRSDFRREFKVYAAEHDMKLNELLMKAFRAYRTANGD